MLSADDIIKAGKPEAKTITTSIGEVRIKLLSFAEGRQLASEDTDSFDKTIEMIQKCLVNEDGSPLFSDPATLNGLSAELIKELSDKCCEVNGLEEQEGN